MPARSDAVSDVYYAYLTNTRYAVPALDLGDSFALVVSRSSKI